MIRTLKPIIDHNSYSSPIAKAIFDYFDQLIYAPLKAIVLNKEKENATVTPLEDALRRGVMEYRDGYFVGAYKASITRELRGIGAIYSHQRKVYYIEISRLPQNILQAISAGNQSSQNIIDKVNKILREKELEGPKPMDLTPFFGATIAKLGKQFFTTTKPVTSADLEIPINPKFADEMEEAYTKNLNLYIQGWHQEAIERMRVKMSQAFAEGRRAENLLGIIQSERGVSYNKAKFLARQETGLLTASYAEIRYKDIGINEYIWQASLDERTRPDHKRLHGHLFRFDHPPITNTKTGAKNNPGEDYNCVPEDSRIDFTGIIEKCFRRWYSGELTTIITNSGKTIRATPNHPVLTINGWKPIGLLNYTDHIIDLSEELRHSSKANHNDSIPTVGEIFESYRKSSFTKSFPGQREQFHGDGSNNNIDVINPTRDLSFNSQVNLSESIYQFFFSLSDFLTFGFSGFNQHGSSLLFRNIFNSNMRFSGKGLPFFKRHLAHPNPIGFGSRANSDIGFDESYSNSTSFQPCTFRNGQLTFPRKICFDNRFWVNINSIMRVVPLSISHIKSSLYDGFVYNFQTKQGYYTSTGVIVSNCRCKAVPYIRGGINMVTPSMGGQDAAIKRNIEEYATR